MSTFGLPDLAKEIVVIINEDQPEITAKFTVPERLLVETSDFFKAACHNDWKEATSRVVKLPEVDGSVSTAYLLWVHMRQLPTASGQELGNLVHHLVRLWLLADRLADSELCNAVIDMITKKITEIKNAEGLDYKNSISTWRTTEIWSATTPNRSIRRLTIDYYMQRWAQAR